MQRLDKYLCDCGVGTRSQVKQLLKAGRISLDGCAVRDGSMKIDPDGCCVQLDGQGVRRASGVVVVVNKPSGYGTAAEDAREKTGMELLPEAYKRLELRPVGRLDKETEGLLLFTNDGDLLHRLITPRNQVRKVYYARHIGTATAEDVEAFRLGLTLRDGTQCRSAELKPLGEGESLITVCEGKYHQVRRMMASRQMTVTYLQRRAEGPLSLGDLPLGQVRQLTQAEVADLEK